MAVQTISGVITVSWFDFLKKRRETQSLITQMIVNQSSPEDPLGSYTGKPTEPGETPTQDADDL